MRLDDKDFDYFVTDADVNVPLAAVDDEYYDEAGDDNDGADVVDAAAVISNDGDFQLFLNLTFWLCLKPKH